jgi:hypothetical protein
MSKGIEMNRLLESSNDEQLGAELQKMNSLISKMDTDEQLGLAGELSNIGLRRLYSLMNSTVMVQGAKEHLAYGYFVVRIKQQGLDDELLAELLQAYSETEFLAIASILIDALKRDVMTVSQLEAAEKIVIDQTFLKEATAFKYRVAAKAGLLLNREDIKILLNLRAYSTLAFVLDENAVAQAALDLFHDPIDGEKDKKKKRALFQKANR